MFELPVPIQVFCKSTEGMPESQNTHTKKVIHQGHCWSLSDCYLLLEKSILKTRGLGLWQSSEPEVRKSGFSPNPTVSYWYDLRQTAPHMGLFYHQHREIRQCSIRTLPILGKSKWKVCLHELATSSQHHRWFL